MRVLGILYLAKQKKKKQVFPYSINKAPISVLVDPNKKEKEYTKTNNTLNSEIQIYSHFPTPDYLLYSKSLRKSLIKRDKKKDSLPLWGF